MRKFKCIKSFEVDMYDENGFYEDDKININIGEIYEMDEDDVHRIIGGDVHLELIAENKYAWLEISNEDLQNYFEEIKE